MAPALVCGLGLLAVFHPMITSGLRLTHGGLGDARLVAYTLEHGFRWLIQMPGHENFWNPPIFYPYPNVSAFTEVLLGVGPLYWIWRFLGLEPDTSFQLWMLSVWALNYLAAYYLLRRGFLTRPVAAACGALVFAFGTSLQAHFGHPQLAPLFYVALAFTAVLRLFQQRYPDETGGRRGWWIAVFFISVTLQAYTCFYTFFFFGMLLAIAALWAVALPGARAGLRETVAEYRWAILLGMVGCAVALGHLASHYLVTAENLGIRIYDPERSPSWASWLLVHGRNYLYGGLSRFLRAQDWPLGQGPERTGFDHARAVGMGVLSAPQRDPGAFGASGLRDDDRPGDLVGRRQLVEVCPCHRPGGCRPARSGAGRHHLDDPGGDRRRAGD